MEEDLAHGGRHHSQYYFPRQVVLGYIRKLAKHELGREAESKAAIRVPP